LGALGGTLGELSGLASLGALNLGGRSPDTEEALAVLRSRQFTENLIVEKNLMPRLFPKDWDSAANRWRTDDVPTPERAYRYFDKKIRSIVQDKRTGLITLSIDWRDREEAAAWANELPERLNHEMRSRAIRESDALVGFLETELQETSTVVTRDAIGRLMEAQIRQRMLANVTQEYSFRIVDKALPPDEDNPFKPNKLRVLIIGLVVGSILGVLLVFLRLQLRLAARIEHRSAV
jgi:uncharacterized protein involved in exopolysaccharide biosynthesis